LKNIKIAKSRNVNYVKCGMLYFIWPKVTDNMGGPYFRAANCFSVIKVFGRFIGGFYETWVENTYIVFLGKGWYDTIVLEVF